MLRNELVSLIYIFAYEEKYNLSKRPLSFPDVLDLVTYQEDIRNASNRVDKRHTSSSKVSTGTMERISAANSQASLRKQKIQVTVVIAEEQQCSRG